MDREHIPFELNLISESLGEKTSANGCSVMIIDDTEKEDENLQDQAGPFQRENVYNSFVELAQNEPSFGWSLLFFDSEVLDNLIHAEKQIIIQAHKESVPCAIVPNINDIFNAFDWTPLSKVKAVLVGQDPYTKIINGRPQAWGASFATRPDCPLQPSIANIYKELANTVEGFVAPRHGDLRPWAEQGVLLLNRALTLNISLDQKVERYKHYSFWIFFVKQVLNLINRHRPNSVVVLWGNKAQEVEKFCGKLLVLKAAHPSPFSCKNFYGCNHFNMINEHLIARNENPIDWRL